MRSEQENGVWEIDKYLKIKQYVSKWPMGQQKLQRKLENSFSWN